MKLKKREVISDMGEIKFSESQLEVINGRHANMLVSAAAGSGKTEVLSERIISLITDKENPIDIDRMVILTFTEAAAAEMRERVTNKLTKLAEEKPEDERLFSQSMLVQNALITTIDSFCLFIIRNNFADINLDPGFRVLDKGEKELMLKDSFDELVDKRLENEEDGDIRLLLDYLDEKSGFEEQTKKFADFLFGRPDRDKWIRDALNNYQIKDEDDFYQKKLIKFIEQEARLIAKDALTLADASLRICERVDECPDIDVMSEVRDKIHDIACSKSIKELKNKAEQYKVPSVKRKDYPGRETVKQNKNDIKKFVDEIKGLLNFDVQRVMEDDQRMLKVIKAFTEFTCQYMDLFDEKKRERNVIDFVDMERFALKILSTEEGSQPSKTALEYQDFFKVIMVDEYQDSNALQESILTKICSEDNYFMVGDVKQSIYGFRGACPEIFTEKYNRFQHTGINKKIDLNKNFRSRNCVLDFTNLIFETVMNQFTCGGIDYDDNASLKFGSFDYQIEEDTLPELLVADISDLDDIENLPEGGKIELEGRMVASRIQKLMADRFQVFDKKDKCKRDIRYSDIVILLRTEKDWNDTFKRALEEKGIPAYATAKRGYFDTLEIRGILNYLQVIDNPRQDISFWGVLTGVIGGFDISEAALFKPATGMSLFDSFLGSDEATLSEKKSRLADMLEKHTRMAKYMSLRELIETILVDTDYLNYMTALPAGEKRKANILALLEKASDFEKTSYHGLFQFNRYIKSLKAQNVDEGEAGSLIEGDDVVRIMSMHRSKGLEFPVVFVSGLGKSYNFMDVNSKILVDDELGLGMDYFEPNTRIKRKDIRRDAIGKAIKRKITAEEMRILYVAMTRAKEKLILTGSSKTKDFESLSGEGMLISSVINGFSKYMDVIANALSSRSCLPTYLRMISPEEIGLDIISDNVNDVIKKSEMTTLGEAVSDADLQDMKDAMNPEYHGQYLKGLYIKTSVSALKKAAYEQGENSKLEFEAEESEERHFEDPASAEPVPDFAVLEKTENVNIGALKGTAAHRLMELLPFKDTVNLESGDKIAFIKQVMETNKSSGLLEEELYELINIKKCANFLDSSLAKRMATADSEGMLYREKSFFYGIDANRINPDFPESERILVQGVIDAYFIEDGDIVLMDYKTDKCSDEYQLIEKYKKQLDIYEEALREITGKKVKERLIYSFCLEKVISL